jgi:hypothetical protein
MKLVSWFTVWDISIPAFSTKISLQTGLFYVFPFERVRSLIKIQSVERDYKSVRPLNIMPKIKKKALYAVFYIRVTKDWPTICGNLMYASWPFHTLRYSVQMHCTYLTLITTYTLFWQQNSSRHKTIIDRFQKKALMSIHITSADFLNQQMAHRKFIVDL